ncbi:MAG: hypothetical protein K8S25_03235 [Alphaproteobacteria bacterium]|nr:hypothetical protein [Alphaproteobacteria bacterium]
MSRLLRFGAGALVAVWTAVCVVAYVMVEVVGEAFVASAGAVVGSPLASLLGFLHDLGMVLLVLVWVIVAWLIWTAGRFLGAPTSTR